jgi:arylsulfatase A-like enzyme
MLHVPFVLRLPAGRGPVEVDRAQLASLADLTPTLLATAGLAPAEEVAGRNLLRPAADARSDRGRYLIARTTGDQPLYALRTSTWKLILSGSGQGGLYNVQRDPAERQDLSLRVRPVFSGLGLLMTERLRQPARFEALPELEALPEDDAEMLKALGYLQ